MFGDAIREQAERVLRRYREQGLKIATAESCTGGLIAALLTEIAGSSDVFERGFVTYSNEAKQELLGVPEALLAEHGAVSEPVARAMAEGALKYSRADVAVSVTGIAGPGGGTETKPVGLVYMGYAKGEQLRCERHVFAGNRAEVRRQVVERSLEILLESGFSKSLLA